MVLDKHKIIATIVIGFSVLVLFFSLLWVLSDRGGSSDGGNTSGEVVEGVYRLDPVEEEAIRAFAPLFANLYHSYGYEDFKSAYNEASYGTVAFQNKAVDYFAKLQEVTPEGFSQETKVNPDSFKYTYPVVGEIRVLLDGVVTETTVTGSKAYDAQFEITFVRVEDDWIVDDFIVTTPQ